METGPLWTRVLPNHADILSRVLANCSRSNYEPGPYRRFLTSAILLQGLQYFHKLWKDNLVVDSQY